MKIFAVSVCASERDRLGNVTVHHNAWWANIDEDDSERAMAIAIGAATKKAKEEYKEIDGFYHHSVSVMEIPPRIIRLASNSLAGKEER